MRSSLLKRAAGLQLCSIWKVTRGKVKFYCAHFTTSTNDARVSAVESPAANEVERYKRQNPIMFEDLMAVQPTSIPELTVFFGKKIRTTGRNRPEAGEN
jgi:hypothetical protein